MGADVKVAVECGQGAEAARGHGVADGVMPGLPAPGLADHVKAPCLFGSADHFPGLGQGGGHGFFADDMAAGPQRGAGDGAVGLGNGQVKDEIRAVSFEHGRQVGGGLAIRQPVLGDLGLGALQPEIDHRRHPDTLGLERREPGIGNAAGTTDHGGKRGG